MHPENPYTTDGQDNLSLYQSASVAPAEAYEADPEFRDAFDAELRQLAEEIVAHHPSLTQLLLSMSANTEENPLHMQN